jgi:hypothetical protein
MNNVIKAEKAVNTNTVIGETLALENALLPLVPVEEEAVAIKENLALA